MPMTPTLCKPPGFALFCSVLSLLPAARTSTTFAPAFSHCRFRFGGTPSTYWDSKTRREATRRQPKCVVALSTSSSADECWGGSDREGLSTAPNVVVGNVFTMSGQEACRRLGRSPAFDRVSALVGDAELFAALGNDDRRALATDGVTALAAGGASSSTPAPDAPPLRFDAAVIASDVAPAADAVRRFVLDASSCGARAVVMTSRAGPSGDLSAWRLAEEVATEAARSAKLDALTIVRTAEQIGGPYYRVDPDLLAVSNAKFITTAHRDFAVEAVEEGGRGRRALRQKDFGASRPVVAKILEEVLLLQCGKTASAASEGGTSVSVLNAVSIEGEAPDEESWRERVRTALRTAETKSPPPRANGNEAPSSLSSRDDALPFSDFATLSPLSMPQRPSFQNPFLAPPAVSGPYWFFVMLVVVGSIITYQEWTWCNVHWAVDPGSPFHLPVTEDLCTCDEAFRSCRPVGRLAEFYDNLGRN